jgi:hypothetical protein
MEPAAANPMDQHLKRLKVLLRKTMCMKSPLYRFRFYLRNVNPLLFHVLKKSRVVWDSDSFKYKAITQGEFKYTIQNINTTNFLVNGELFTGIYFLIGSLSGVVKGEKRLHIPRKKVITLRRFTNRIVVIGLKYICMKISKPDWNFRVVFETSSAIIAQQIIREAFGKRIYCTTHDVKSIPQGPIRAYLDSLSHKGRSPMQWLKIYMETCDEYLTKTIKSCSTRPLVTQEQWIEKLKSGFRRTKFHVNGKTVKGLRPLIRELIGQDLSKSNVHDRFINGLRYSYLISPKFFPQSFQSNLERIQAGGIEHLFFERNFYSVYYDCLGILPREKKRRYLFVNDHVSKKTKR